MVYNVSISPGPNNSLPSSFSVTVGGAVTLCLRYQSAVGLCHPVDGNKVTVNFPSIGNWIAIISPNTPTGKNLLQTPFNLSTSLSTCAPNMAGPSCNFSISSADTSQLGSGTLSPRSWAFYRVPATYPFSPLWVTVGSGTPSPQVYVSINQVPTETSFILQECNQPYCDTNNIFKLTGMEGNYIFYVGIYNSNTTQSVSYGIWFNNTCAPGCGNYGRCTESGPETGLCVCTTDYVGYDCGTLSENGLPAQYIVLIIIASLVVASAIIGFIAWAYMQKKRTGYSSLGAERT